MNYTNYYITYTRTTLYLVITFLLFVLLLINSIQLGRCLLGSYPSRDEGA